MYLVCLWGCYGGVGVVGMDSDNPQDSLEEVGELTEQMHMDVCLPQAFWPQGQETTWYINSEESVPVEQLALVNNEHLGMKIP